MLAEVIKKYLIEYPEVQNRTLARLIYHKYSHLFKDLDSVLWKIRYYRGKAGKYNKNAILNKYGKPF